MDLNEFRELMDAARTENPFWFEAEGDPPAAQREIVGAESELGVRFPRDYQDFLRNFGGGDFALTNVFSVAPESFWNVVERNKELNIPGFLAISDDEAGGYYGYRVEDDAVDRRIFYWDHDGREVVGPEYDDLFSFIAATGLN